MLKKLLLNKKTYVVGYILLMAILIGYTKSVLKNTKVTVSDKSKQEEEFEVKPVSVSFQISSPRGKIEYKLKMKNNDSLIALLETVREQQNITYEKTEYIYGTEITSAIGYTKNEWQSWSLWEKTSSNNIKKILDVNKQRLLDEATYLLIYRNTAQTETPVF